MPFSHQRPKHLFLVHHAESKPDFIDDIMATATATAATASSFASASSTSSTPSKGGKGGEGGKAEQGKAEPTDAELES